MLVYDSVAVDQDSCTVTYQGKKIGLSAKEYQLLLLFLQHPKCVFNYESLAEKLWTQEKQPTDSCIRSHIKRLRRAFKKVDSSADIIDNIHGFGYRLKADINNRSRTDCKDILTTKIVPNFSLVQKVLDLKKIDYLVIDDQFKIHYYSPKLSRYSNLPEYLEVGNDARQAFLELAGLEEAFGKLSKGDIESFQIQGVSKILGGDECQYITCLILANSSAQIGLDEEKLFFIFFEDTSELISYKQQFMQKEIESCLQVQNN